MKTKRKNNHGGAAAGPSRVRFPNIRADAAALGVERSHLWRVLTGRRESRSLLRRYGELAREGGAR